MSVLVVGAYGTVGSHVAAGLVSAGVPVRGTSRTPGAGGSPDAVEMVRMDLGVPETLPAALDGVRKVFLYVTAAGVTEFLAAARAAGVEHVVLLSSAATVEPVLRRSRSARQHAAVEQEVRDSGIGWTFLCPTTFATKQLTWAPVIRAGEELRIPFLRMPSASIHERDIADVAVRVLTDAGHEGRVHWLTGPAALTQQEHIEVIGAAIGRAVDVVEIAPQDAVPRYPDMFIQTMTEAMKLPCVVTATVEEITGTPARPFRQWAEEHVKEFG